ncbi:MAG: MFS transporter [Flavobacteriales bacterium]|nr:MFS transporter [Flavobacteriales bacterium]
MEEKFNLLDFKDPKIRTLHATWFAFFVTFYVWFNMAPLATTMLNSVDWLTKEHIKILAICNVALTIPARILIGSLTDKYGPRAVFSGLMVVMAIPAFVFAFANSFMQLLVARLVLGSIGAGFVIGIKMMAIWFPKNMIGRAEGFYAGWGNFGSAWAAMTLPWFAITVCSEWFGLGDNGWRYAVAANGLVSLVYGFAYYFLVTDHPPGKTIQFASKAEPMRVTSYFDLVQYIVWSFPLMGAMAVLAWRIAGIQVEGHHLLSDRVLYIIYAVLGLMYMAHVVKVLQINLPDLKKGIPESKRYPWGSVAALNTTYFANFGAELAVVSMLPMFFESVFKGLTTDAGTPLMTATMAGLVAASFAFVNLIARPLGGYLSDMMANRKRTMLIYMAGITLGFFAMSFIAKYGPIVDGVQTLLPMFDGVWWLVAAVIITIACSMFVQGAEGATFAIIPMIKRGMTGQIAGMAGAYGNVGAVCYLVLYSLVDDKTFFYWIAAGAGFSTLYCWIFLKEPEEAYKDEY